MDEFEAVGFAGLSPDHYHIVWVRHAHLHREEMHFIIPRIELATGKSLNVAPPGRASRALFDAWRSKVNAQYGLADPDDPARRSAVSLPGHIAKLKNRPGQTRASYSADVRECITRFIEAKVREGLVKNRADVVRVLKQAGFSIPRQGRDYVTVQHPSTSERFRLRGLWYEDKPFREINPIPSPATRPDPIRAAQFARQLEPLREARARYHRQRYGETIPAPEPTYDRTGNPPARRTQTIGSTIPGPRPGVCRHAANLDRATRNLERAGERLSRAHRALARDYEAALSRARGRHRVKIVLREYGRALEQDLREEELEREIER